MSLNVTSVALQRMDGMKCCCDTVISATGELLLFSPRSGSSCVPLRVVQGPHLWHRLCLYLFNSIWGTSFWSVLHCRLSFFTVPFHTTPPTTLPLPSGRGRAGSLVPSSMSWFQITVRAGSCAAVLAVCLCLNSFVPLTCLPPSSCRHTGGPLQEDC